MTPFDLKKRFGPLPPIEETMRVKPQYRRDKNYSTIFNHCPANQPRPKQILIPEG